MRIAALCLLAVCCLAFSGCSKKADESKPLPEVKAEAEKMNVDQLKSMAMSYKDSIMAKQGDIEKVASQLKEIPIAKMMGDEAKNLKSEIDALNKSLSALKDRFQVYYDKLKEKGGDLSSLKL